MFRIEDAEQAKHIGTISLRYDENSVEGWFNAKDSGKSYMKTGTYLPS